MNWFNKMTILFYLYREGILCAIEMDNWCRRTMLLLLRVEVYRLNVDKELSTFDEIKSFCFLLYSQKRFTL